MKIQVSKLVKFSVKVFRFPIYLLWKTLIGLVPKKKGLWIFGAWEGNAFSDNAKYLYLHLLSNKLSITPVWMTTNSYVMDEVSNSCGLCCALNTWKALWMCIRAECVFITHSVSTDLNAWFISGSRVIQLYHASFPIKKMGYDDGAFSPKSGIKRILNYISCPGAYEKVDLGIASSFETQKLMAGIIGIDTSDVVITGYPRAQALLERRFSDLDLKRVNQVLGDKKYDNIIYYVPTFRSKYQFNMFEYRFSLKKLEELLSATNSIFIIRLHPFAYEKNNLSIGPLNSRIIFENHQISDIYPLLSFADILLTDYSSIFSDYLLLNRPIIFAAFDLDKYLSKERALYFPFKRDAPGPCVSNWSELLDSLRRVLIDKTDDYIEERNNFKERIFSKDLSLRACENIVNYIQSR